jgi:hypothetical protein
VERVHQDHCRSTQNRRTAPTAIGALTLSYVERLFGTPLGKYRKSLLDVRMFFLGLVSADVGTILPYKDRAVAVARSISQSLAMPACPPLVADQTV